MKNWERCFFSDGLWYRGTNYKVIYLQPRGYVKLHDKWKTLHFLFYEVHGYKKRQCNS